MDFRQGELYEISYTEDDPDLTATQRNERLEAWAVKEGKRHVRRLYRYMYAPGLVAAVGAAAGGALGAGLFELATRIG